MLIQTAFNPLPNKLACNNGAVLMGSSVSSMCAALSQLTHVKFLGMANYPIMRSTFNAYTSSPYQVGVAYPSSLITMPKGYTESHKLFYASTPISTYLCAIVVYEAGTTDSDPTASEYSPRIDIVVKALNDSGSGYVEVATADYGISMNSGNSLLLQSALYDAGRHSHTYYADTGITVPRVPPTSTALEPPRPLYLPPTAGGYDVRGEVVAINVDAEDCKIKNITLLDVYIPEVAP